MTLTRRVPLQRSRQLTAGLPLRRVPLTQQRRRDTGPSDETRQLVATRAAWRCERCGQPVGNASRSWHHRLPRRAGGSRNAALNTATNLGLLCGSATSPGGCHAWVESHRAAAYLDGWLVHSQEDPASIPVRVHAHGFVYLDASGEYVEGSP